MYSIMVWKHIREPQNRKQLEAANAIGRSFYHKCGDDFILQLRIDDGSIVDAAFLSRGCGPVIAAGSVGTELLKGLTLAQAEQISAFQLDKLLGGLPSPKRHAILLFLDSLHQALEGYRSSPTHSTLENNPERNL